jgi:hypothetical protein
MRQLAQGPALTLERIQEALEVAFVKDEGASHDMVTFFGGTPRPGSRFEGLVTLVDCRVPTENTALKGRRRRQIQDKAGAGDSAAANAALGQDAVARFGQRFFQPSLPEDPEVSASYIYKIGSRSLWVSLGRQNPEEVRGVSIHPLEDVR